MVRAYPKLPNDGGEALKYEGRGREFNSSF